MRVGYVVVYYYHFFPLTQCSRKKIPFPPSPGPSISGDKFHKIYRSYRSCFSVDRTKYQIQIPLPPKIDPSVTMMTVEEKPDVTYDDVGGCKDQIEKLKEVVELPLLHSGRFVKLGIDPPKGVLLYGKFCCLFHFACCPVRKGDMSVRLDRRGKIFWCKMLGRRMEADCRIEGERDRWGFWRMMDGDRWRSEADRRRMEVIVEDDRWEMA
jgi:hypothetical protein